MTRLLLIIVFSLLGFSGRSQLIADRVNTYVAEHKIDTFLIYSLPCSGGIFFDSCEAKESHYLFWKKENSFFLKRFGYCKTYKIVSLDTVNPLAFYLRYRKVIDKEEIKQPTYYQVVRKGKTIDTLTVTSGIDHSCYHTFHLPFAKKAKTKSADIYDLEFKVFKNERKNIFYSYNQKTKFKLLIDQTTFLLNMLVTKGEFQSD